MTVLLAQQTTGPSKTKVLAHNTVVDEMPSLQALKNSSIAGFDSRVA
jgi:hypothetical protein